MWLVALTLGFFGSLHCIGMCGPLALAFCDRPKAGLFQRLAVTLSYNLGRVVTYGILGVLFGLMGSIIIIADLQKVISIVIGIVFITAFIFSVDIDKSLSRMPVGKRMIQQVHLFLSSMIKTGKRRSPFILGMVNGLLPCGLVYVAIAGALTVGGFLEGGLFMMLFGLGTIPAMGVLTMSVQMATVSVRARIRRIVPFVTLAFGIFLIYRGIVIDMPLELNFWEALKNPVMCH